jgi:hypothetical protein
MFTINHPITVNITNKCGLRNKQETKMKVNLGTRCSLKMSKNMNKRATENSTLKFLTVSSVSSDSIVFICNIDRDWMIYRKHPIRSLLTSMLRKASIRYHSDVSV